MKTTEKTEETPTKTYTPPAVQDLGKWTAVTLQNSIPVIPVGPGTGNFLSDAFKNW